MQFSFVNAQKGVINNGARIVVDSGAVIKINGLVSEANYTNKTFESVNGRIDLDGKIKLKGNWINNAISGNVLVNVDTDGEVIFNGPSTQSIAGNYVSSFEKLTTNNPNGLSLLKDINVYGALTLTSGNITLNNYNLSLQTTGSITAGTYSATKMIVTNSSGSLRKYFSSTGSFTFPIGETTVTPEYSPVSFTLTGGSGFSSAYVGAKVTDAKHPNNGSVSEYITRYWTLSSSGISEPVYDASFKYTNIDIVGPEANIYSAQYNGTIRNKYSNVTAASNTVDVTGLSTFYDYTGVDGTSPGIVLSSSVPARTNTAFTVTFTFTENVLDFNIDDISVTNAIKSAFAGSGSVYTATITPSANDAVTVKVLAGIAQDAATNQNTLSNTISTIFDNVKPGVSLTPSIPNPINTNFVVRFTFTEDITGFDISKITTTNATVTGFTQITANRVWDATINPTTNGTTVTVNVNANVAQDAAGNLNTVSNTITTVYDITKPGVNLTSTENILTNENPFIVTISFDEDVSGFTIGDINVSSNANVTGLVNITPNRVWNATITPTSDGNITVDVLENKAFDFAGNSNEAAPQFSIIYDGTKPEVTISSTAPNQTNISPIPFSITFSEEINLFAISDIIVGNGSALSLTTSDSIEFTLNVTPSGSIVTVNIPDGVASDNAGNTNNVASQFSRIFDIAAPTAMELYPLDNQFDISVSDNLQITFNENVNIGTGNIEIRKVSPDELFESIPVSTLSGGTTITINPVSDFGSEIEYYVTIPSTAFLDDAGNTYAGIASTTAWTFTTADINKPVISTLSPLDDALNVSITANLVITFNEIVNKGTGYVTVKKSSDNSNYSLVDVTSAQVTGDGTTTITIDLPVDLISETSYYVNIDATAFKDADLNNFAGIASSTYWNFKTEDNTSPVTSAFNPLNGAVNVNVTSNLQITFSENVAKGSVGNIQIMKSTTPAPTVHETINVNSGQVSISGSIVTINPSINFDSETNYYIIIDEGAIKDLSGNEYAGISAVDEWTFKSKDITAPTVEVSSLEPNPTNNAFEVIIRFSEDIQFFESGDISSSANLSSITQINDTAYSVVVSPTSNGIVTVQVTASVCQDLAGNNNTASNIFEIEFDNIQPTVVISSLETSPTNSPTFNIQIDFSEEVTGFILDEIDINNGTITDFNIINSTSYTAEITPSDDGLVKVNINSGVATDDAGNGNTVASEFYFIFDSTSPTVFISSIEPDPTNNMFEVLIEFSEKVQNFTIDDISEFNCNLSGFTELNDSTYTVDVTPIASGLVSVQVSELACQDFAGNSNVESNILEREFDNINPSVEITSNETDPVSNSPFEITISFSEIIDGFDISYVIVDNGEPSNMILINDSTYTVDITPEIIGVITVDINAGVVTDLAGNGNNGATQFSINFTGTKPKVVISSLTTSPTNLSAITLNIVFTESVFGFIQSDVQVTNGDLSNFSSSNNMNYSVTLLPDQEGLVTVLIPEGVAQNSIANGNEVSNTFRIIYDITEPSVVISSSENSPTNSNSIPITISFSENIIGFDLTDIDVQNGSVSGISNVNNVYSTTLIPLGDGTVIVNIASAEVLDSAGNYNTAASEFSFVFDRISPTVVISHTESTITEPQFKANITFSEEVTGFVNSDLSLVNATLNSLTTTDNILYLATITAINKGNVKIDIAAGVATDFAGNNNTAASQFTINYDPSVGITDVQQYKVMIYSVQGEIIIEISNPNNTKFQNGHIEIFNILGVSVNNKQMDNFSIQRIPINNASTIYVVKLNLDGEVYTKKVYVNR